MMFATTQSKEVLIVTQTVYSTEGTIFVGMDIAKETNDVLIGWPDGKRKRFKVANKAEDFRKFADFLKSLGQPCQIGFEATGNYHRPLAYFLERQGFELKLISSLAAARVREALYNSWDKNDPKDAQVILHLLKTGTTQTYHDALTHGINEIQEIAKTYYQVVQRKVRVQHSLLTHYLPLYFPEVQKYWCTSRADWFSQLLLRFPTPASVRKYSQEEFSKAVWDIAGRKVNKAGWIADFYTTAGDSIGIPVEEDSEAVRMFRLVLQEHLDLCRMRRSIEQQAAKYLENNPDYKRLQTIPGIGPMMALIILSEAGDLRRFSHYKKFLKYCGFNLCTHQSGQFRGMTKISKQGSKRLRYAFWMAAITAIRMRENTFRKKYENYIKTDPLNKDVRRKAVVAVAAKIARVAYGLIKSGTDYRCYFETAVPSGKIPSARAVEAILTS
jgi:transposase